MTIEISRGNNTFQYRQREDEPTVIESRAVYRGSPWRFVARFATEAEARAALMAIGTGQEEEER